MLIAAMWMIAVAGLAGASVYLGLVLAAAARFQPRRVVTPTAALPPVTILKPLHGDEPGLEQNLESFFRQRYPVFELVFGARLADDAALAVVERVRRRYPQVPVKIVLSGEPDRPNAKVCSLGKMVEAAEHEHLIISDSDVRVGRDYIHEVIRPLLEPKVGMVTCLYRGVATGGLWARLEALGMSVEMTSGVLVADMLEGMKFALGPTMAIRKDALANVGGFAPLAGYCADDYVLGREVNQAGYEVVLSRYVVDHVVLSREMRPSLQHQARWMRSTRFSRQWGHIGTGLTFAMPFGLLALAAGALSGWPSLGAGLFLAAVLNRVAQALVVGWAVVRDRDSQRYCWLYPLRDLLGFGFWVWSFLGATIVWRGERYRLLPGGAMVPCAGQIPAASSLKPGGELVRDASDMPPAGG